MKDTDEVVELDSLSIHQLWTPQPYFRHIKVNKIYHDPSMIYQFISQEEYRDNLITPTESLHIWPNKTVQFYTIITLQAHCRKVELFLQLIPIQ